MPNDITLVYFLCAFSSLPPLHLVFVAILTLLFLDNVFALAFVCFVHSLITYNNTSIKSILKNVERCRDGYAKNYRN